jgi:hypothetical protein
MNLYIDCNECNKDLEIAEVILDKGDVVFRVQLCYDCLAVKVREAILDRY